MTSNLTTTPMPIKSLIVDDEESCRETLRFFLKEYCPEIEITGSADNIEDAYRHITLHKPALVFLDISMPPSDGFELLRKFKKLPFEFIFTTAYNQYAIQAIRFSAADYLLKPIDPVELIGAVARVREKMEKSEPKAEGPGKIVLMSDRSYFFVDMDSIINVELQNRKTIIHLKDNRKHDITKTIQEMEELLDHNFLRCHRSYIINLKEIKEYIPDKHGGCVIMSNKMVVPIADRRKEEFLKLFSRGRL
jgi:two-component system, LytTR family, response regulator